MSTPNCTIEFAAKNALVAGVTAGDLIKLHVVLTAFDKTIRTEKKINKTYNGDVSSSKQYSEATHSLAIIDLGNVEFEDTSTTTMTPAYVEMFLLSVDNSEEFTITDLDNSDNEVTVQIATSSAHSRSRPSAAFINKFNYQFTCREVIA